MEDNLFFQAEKNGLQFIVENAKNPGNICSIFLIKISPLISSAVLFSFCRDSGPMDYQPDGDFFMLFTSSMWQSKTSFNMSYYFFEICDVRH